jgi:hypothetical protein
MKQKPKTFANPFSVFGEDGEINYKDKMFLLYCFSVLSAYLMMQDSFRHLGILSNILKFIPVGCIGAISFIRDPNGIEKTAIFFCFALGDFFLHNCKEEYYLWQSIILFAIGWLFILQNVFNKLEREEVLKLERDLNQSLLLKRYWVLWGLSVLLLFLIMLTLTSYNAATTLTIIVYLNIQLATIYLTNFSVANNLLNVV